jgi:prepilin-type N-terminal cleavage/methylation domain-containing protein
VFVLNWRNNKGFSLVELIIAMAILSLVSLTVAGMMKTGTSTYNSAKSELDLQMESQILLAQINTMILEANYASYDSANNVLALYTMKQQRVALPTPSAAVAGTPEYTTTKTVDKLKIIKFKSSNNCLYLQDSSVDVTLPASGGSLDYPDDELFSKYMDSFDVVVDGSSVTVKIGMKAGKQKYKATATTKMRNGLISYP